MKQTAIFILGMHRSGTSLLASLVEVLGIDVGDELYPPDVNNPRGYFEDRACVDIQERILHTLGLPWHEEKGMLPLPDYWWRQPAILPLIGELDAWLQTRIRSGQPIWALKDPRTTRFLPMWNELLGRNGIRLNCVLAVREPEAVVASEVKRDHVPVSRVFHTWLRYNADALLHSGAALRGVFVYERWFTDGLEQMRHLARVLDRSVTDPQLEHLLRARLDAGLRRQTGQGVVTPDWARDVYRRLVALADDLTFGGVTALAAETEYLSTMLILGGTPSLEGSLELVVAHPDDQSLAIDLAEELARQNRRPLVLLSAPDAIVDPPETITIPVIKCLPDGPPVAGFGNIREAYSVWRWLQSRKFEMVHFIGGHGLAVSYVDARRQGLLNPEFEIQVHYPRRPRWMDPAGRVSPETPADLTAFVLEQRLLGDAALHITGRSDLIATLRALGQDGGRGESPTMSRELDAPPLVSICITHHNRPDFLADCVESCRRQTYQNIELIVVDDGSTVPAARALLSSWQSEFHEKSWQIIVQDNQYLGHARNTAARHANGSCLFFLDDDNLLMPDTIARAVDIMTRTQCDVVGSVMAQFSGPPGVEPLMASAVLAFIGASPLIGMIDNCFGDAAALVRRSVWAGLGGFSELRNVGAEDWEFFARAALAGYRFEVSVRPLSWYRVSDSGMARSGQPAVDRLRAQQAYRDILPLSLQQLPQFTAALVISFEQLRAVLNQTRKELAVETEARARSEAEALAHRETVTHDFAHQQKILDQTRTENMAETAQAALTVEVLHQRAMREERNAERREIQRLHNELQAAHKTMGRLMGSMSWRITRPLRALFSRFPAQTRLTRKLMLFGWWAASIRWRLINEHLGRRRLLDQQATLIEKDPLFDAEYYRRQAPSISDTGWKAAKHYLLVGSPAGLSPHPLFDSSWYRGRYPDIGETEPLVHYVVQGRREDRWPNPYFDPAWYKDRYPEVAACGEDPVVHFMISGAGLGYDPSPNFHTRLYQDRYPEITAGGWSPLGHYLAIGRREGHDIRQYQVDFSQGQDVDEVSVSCRKRPEGAREVALFVTHSAHGRLKPHVRHYLAALQKADISVTLIVAADNGFVDDENGLFDLVDGLYIRDNKGWDFACWAHILRLNRQFYDSEILYWLNDSLIGPINQTDFTDLLSRLRKTDAGMIGLTANYERGGYHLQSYFLAFKQDALRHLAFHEFIHTIRAMSDKEDVINGYEIRFSQTLQAAGIRIVALFEPVSIHNPTIHNWKHLIANGFPFLKVLAITHDMTHIDQSGWREILQSGGYDVEIVDRLLTQKAFPWLEELKQVAETNQQEFAKNDVLGPADDPHIVFVAPTYTESPEGEMARRYLGAFWHLDWFVDILPLPLHDRGYPAIVNLASSEHLRPIDVAIVQATQISGLIESEPSSTRRLASARYRILLINSSDWNNREQGKLEGSDVDMIWTTNEFCAAAIRVDTDIPIQIVPLPISILPNQDESEPRRQLRQRLGLDPTKKLVFYPFDASDPLALSNPLALVRAFDLAGLAKADWVLVLVTGAVDRQKMNIEAVDAQARGSSGSIVMETGLSTDDMRAMLPFVDIVASTHIHDETGRFTLDAMAAARPVVALDYGAISSNVLDRDTGFPVSPQWTTEALGTDSSAPGILRPIVDEAAFAETLQAVAAMPHTDLQKIGDAARERVLRQHHPLTVAQRIRSLLAEIVHD